jgi:hypothetical protein
MANNNLRVPEEQESTDFDPLAILQQLTGSERESLKKALNRTGENKKGGIVSRKRGKKIMHGYKAGGKV